MVRYRRDGKDDVRRFWYAENENQENVSRYNHTPYKDEARGLPLGPYPNMLLSEGVVGK